MLSMVFTDGINSILRGLTVGGSSMLYFGSVTSPPHAMFRRHGAVECARTSLCGRGCGGE